MTVTLSHAIAEVQALGCFVLGIEGGILRFAQLNPTSDVPEVGVVQFLDGIVDDDVFEEALAAIELQRSL